MENVLGEVGGGFKVRGQQPHGAPKLRGAAYPIPALKGAGQPGLAR